MEYKQPLIDLHNDVITEITPAKLKKHLKHAQNNNVKTILISIWTTKMKNPLHQIKHYSQFANDLKKLYPDIDLRIHIEDVWFLNEQNIDEFICISPYSVGLTWNNKNPLGSGASNIKGGITELGWKIIKKLTLHDIIIDLAHLNRQSFFQVSNFLIKNNKKLLCTHTCFDGICSHLRNLDNDQIQMIVNSNGLVGLTLVGDFLTTRKNAKKDDLFNHINYFIKNFGTNNLAIGTDFYGTSNLPKRLKKYKHFQKFRKFLLEKGISETTVNKIYYQNAENFFNLS